MKTVETRKHSIEEPEIKVPSLAVLFMFSHFYSLQLHHNRVHLLGNLSQFSTTYDGITPQL